jgi:hypothetical protein
MQTQLSPRSAILAVLIVLIFVISWEIHLRNKGYMPDYDDGPELWASKRALVYGSADKTVVFTGSSRIKYDLDIPTWENQTGTDAIQLSFVGSSPRHILTDLAKDLKFKGRVIVDVTEGLFFSEIGDLRPDAGIAYYQKRTPAQNVSFRLGLPLEASLVFLNSNQFSLTGMLGRAHVPDRPEVIPFLDFPAGFENNKRDRQNQMTDAFLADTNQWNQVKAIWGMFAKRFGSMPPMSGNRLYTVIQSVKNDVDKIRARGGDVVFTRTPSSGMFKIGEAKSYPRAKYWDLLLQVTGCKGIYYGDYPETANMQCPEWSHLNPHDAIIYTRTLIIDLEKNTTWKFKATNKTQSINLN